MSGALGLAELLVVLVAVMAWGVYELRSLRKPPRTKGSESPSGRNDAGKPLSR